MSVKGEQRSKYFLKIFKNNASVLHANKNALILWTFVIHVLIESLPPPKKEFRECMEKNPWAEMAQEGGRVLTQEARSIDINEEEDLKPRQFMKVWVNWVSLYQELSIMLEMLCKEDTTLCFRVCKLPLWMECFAGQKEKVVSHCYSWNG